MTDEERRQRIETLLLAWKDWCDESDAFLWPIHIELTDLLFEAENIPDNADWKRRHWANRTFIKIEKEIHWAQDILRSRLIDYQDPAIYETKLQQRADKQRNKKG